MSMLASLLAALAAIQPIPAGEPDPPAVTKRAMECQAPDELAASDHLVLRCATRAKLPAVTILLYYRQSGSEDFTPAPTLRSKKGWYTATLCPHAFAAGPLHYYFEALDAGGKVVASSGDEESPAVVRILPPPDPRAKGHLAPSADAIAEGTEEDPLEHVRAEQAAAQAVERAHARRGADRMFVAFGAGLGYGWYTPRLLDFRKDVHVAAGGGPAGPLVLTPEIGYQLTGRLALSLLARWELISSSGAGDLTPGAPASSALAFLGRASYAWGKGRAQLVASAMAGAGEGVRVVVPPIDGGDVTLSRNDTVRGGPFLVGPGGGFAYHFSPHFAVVVDVRALAGLPDFATVVDVSTGAQLGF
jgi:hypothetical protein